MNPRSMTLLTSHRYERYERVDMGDFNWVSPQFVAFASPQSEPTAPIPPTSPAYATLPSCIPEIAGARISQPFKNVLTHFVQRNVGLVVRLNSELYCPSYFTALGIQHIDMIFEDGTCPQLPIVRKFIKLAADQISRRKAIAVHCKAGLGRTGCLIGAYLIYRHGFTANEVIAFMRFMRPGMVVGPQQHWLHMNQGTFREWQYEDTIKAKYEREAKPSTPRGLSSKTPMRQFSGNQMATPQRSSVQRAALGEIDGNDVNTTAAQDENLPAPTPGQPRKYARMDPRGHTYARSTSAGFRASVNNTTEKAVEATTGLTDSDEEYILQRLAARRSASRSPNAASAKGKGRSVSYTTTTTTTTKTIDMGDMGIYEDRDADVVFGNADGNNVWTDDVDSENQMQTSSPNKKLGMSDSRAPSRSPSIAGNTRSKTPRRSASGMHASGNGSLAGLTKTRGSIKERESPMRRSTDERGKVRKTSGRVGSNGVAQNSVLGGRTR
jgi:protein-tyrosine phosphatase